MSNVRIEATGEVGLSIAVKLGPNERKTHLCSAGEAIDLTVGGNQTLSISAVDDGPTAEAEDTSLPTGVDVVEGAQDGSEPAPSGETSAIEADSDEPSSPEITAEPLDTGDPLQNPFDKG